VNARWWRPDAREALLVYLVGLSARLPAWHGTLFGDEAWHFYGARHLGRAAANVHPMLRDDVAPLAHLVWWRPLFELSLAPAAWISFDAWRLAHILVTATLPLFAWLILRDLGVRRVYAYAAAAVVAFEGLFVSWSAIVFPDSLLTTAFAAGLWSMVRRRPRATGAFFLAAMWVKESALVGVVAVVGLMFVANVRKGRPLCPLVLDPMERAGAWPAGLGLLPLLFYLSQGGAPPGWTHGGDTRFAMDHLTLVLPFAVFIVLGIKWPRTRRFALLALAYPAFYLFIAAVLGRQIETWYLVLPSFLSVVAVALVLDEWHSRARPSQAVGRRVVVGLVGALLLMQVAVPITAAWKGPPAHPITGLPDPSYLDAVRFVNARDRTVPDAFEAVRQRDHGTVFLVDLGWFFTLYPFAEMASTVRTGYSEWYDGSEASADDWAHLVESFAASTLVHKETRPVNEALRSVYADCIVYENPDYVVIDGRGCTGRATDLHERLSRM